MLLSDLLLLLYGCTISCHGRLVLGAVRLAISVLIDTLAAGSGFDKGSAHVLNRLYSFLNETKLTEMSKLSQVVFARSLCRSASCCCLMLLQPSTHL